MNSFTALLLFVTAGALIGWIVAMLAIVYWIVPGTTFIEAVRTAWFVEGMVGGAILGAFIWTLLRPAKRLSHLSGLLVAANCAAWASYLALAPRVADTEFQAIKQERIERDLQRAGEAGSVTLIHDGPWVLAGRESGFWSVNLPHYFVQLLSGGWIYVAEVYVGRARYVGIRPTRAESYVIAAIGFALATAFWSVAGAGLSWLWGVIWHRGTPPRPLQPTSGASASS